MNGYWPSWVVAPLLGSLAVGYWIALRRPFGISGVLARFSRLRAETEFDRGSAIMRADCDALERAITAATAEAFGAEEVAELVHADAPIPAKSEAGARVRDPARPTAPEARLCAPTPTLSAHAVLLVSISVGGFVASLVRGSFGAGIGDAFARTVGSGPRSWMALAVGGILVGFGVSLSAGCTSGHGLTGFGRLMPGSLLATATFFAAAVATSLFLARGLA